MRCLTLLLLVLFTACAARAQQRYFMYLQSESGAPFYVKLGDDIHSSTGSGYLLLPRLSDSTYALALGFPAYPGEARFQLPLGARDRGWLIRRNEGNMALLDLQTGQSVRPLQEVGDGTVYRVRKDDFTLLLSRAAQDTSLLYVPVINTETVAKADPKPAVTPVEKTEEPVKTDTAAVVVAEDPKPSITLRPADSVAITPPILTGPRGDTVDIVQTEPAPAADSVSAAEKNYVRSQVKKYAESSTSEGFGLVFFDRHEEGVDTIRILIPNQRFTIRPTDTIKGEEHDLFLRIDRDSLQRVGDSAKALRRPQVNCEVAGESDFLKLRRMMAAVETDTAMIEVADLYFQTKCFTTEQIRNLSVLFLTPEGKLKFFEKAQFHVADPAAFPKLETEFKDEEYSKRFKALLEV